MDSTEYFPTEEEFVKNDGLFYFTEKIDGCNLGMFIQPDKLPYFFSRNGENADGLFTFKTDKQLLAPFIEAAQRTCREYNAFGIYFWGEYYGNRINRRINYGNESKFRFYNAMLVRESDLGDNNIPRLLSMNSFFALMIVIWAMAEGPHFPYKDFKIQDFILMPEFSKEYMTKDEILEKINPGENSKFAIDHAPREGWIVTYANNDKLFARWKYKNPAFKERERQPKAEKLVDDELLNARLDFMGYLTLNRAIGLLSKTTDRTMKTLLPQFVDDAKEDFFIDHPELKEREEKWQKAIFNAGKTPYLVMLEALEKEKQA